MEEKNGKTIRLSTAVLLFIILILIVALVVTYYFGFVKKNEEAKGNKIAEQETKIEIQEENKKDETNSNITTSNNQTKVENKSTEERYKEYMANLKANLVNELEEQAENTIEIRQKNMVGHEYTINIDKNLNLLVTSNNNSTQKKCTDYKIDKEVLKVYISYAGNGGMQNIYYLKTDGTMYSFDIDGFLNGENTTPKKLEFKNIINVYSAVFSDGMGGSSGPIFEDIEGNLFK